ncbi:DUF6397 family protein [Streptomyces boninensis]|uniref:DUF6397 family protein n=1 Tax=Streptomyces boninensis TaxID=2039455 RepID=UPI003B2122D6
MGVKTVAAPAGSAAMAGLRRAAGELGLKTGELALAVDLGLIAGARRDSGVLRVPVAEIERLRAGEGFPEALRSRLRLVGTREGAELMGVPPTRFLRLAKAGCFEPVRFYVNRYRAVVWLYLASELEAFAAGEPGLLSGPFPPGVRALLEQRSDWRPRGWRARHFAGLSESASGPWERAACAAALLHPDDVAEVVDDPRERAHLMSLRSELAAPVTGGSAAALDVASDLARADTEDEVLWYRLSLAMSLDEARESSAAPGPLPPVGDGSGARRGWAWFRRRG